MTQPKNSDYYKPYLEECRQRSRDSYVHPTVTCERLSISIPRSFEEQQTTHAHTINANVTNDERKAKIAQVTHIIEELRTKREEMQNEINKMFY
jgi:glycine cleavage system regulatory protein